MYFSRGEVQVLDMVAHVFNPKTQEAGGGQIPHFPFSSQTSLYSETLEGGRRETDRV